MDNIIHVPYMPTPGVATTPTHQQFQLGGGATLTATWLAQWDVPVTLTGNAIGNDAYGKQVLEWLRMFPSLSTDMIQQFNDVETPYTRALVPPDGDRYLIEFGYDIAPMHPATEINLDGIDIVTVNYYLNNPEKETLQLAKQAHGLGKTVIASDVVDTTVASYPYADIIINSRAVLEKVYPDHNYEDLATYLHRKDGKMVILTQGESQVFVAYGDNQRITIDVPQVKIHDTTGAGDAFRSGIVYGHLYDLSIEDSIKLAVAAGTLQAMRDASIEPPSSLKETRAFAQQLNVTHS